MVWTGVLRAVLLLSLLSSGIRDVEGQRTVDLKALEHIVSVINVHNNKNPSTSAPASGSASAPDDVQYAMAIRIAKDGCLKETDSANFVSLKEEVSQFKNQLEKKGVYYERNTIIAARPSERPDRHSEYTLLIEDEGKAIKNLLKDEKGRKDDCVIFYTYNSPCLDTCLDEEKDKAKQILYDKQQKKQKQNQNQNQNQGSQSLILKCIYNHLGVLNSLQGPRAFVFTQIYRNDKNKDINLLRTAFKEITKTIPLYQCDNNNKCRPCEENNAFCVPDKL
ncbi:uncharacterized protein LOC118802190 [Colossoma macropomum]|uniref:uncharacterized protein LOC118802190 n=1 Tax=Colossoma macropomum TaxID=42526 RepID=UPI0018641FDB|nr:uncharacterized protein LOC118802190 [Colossoma macropomum]